MYLHITCVNLYLPCWQRVSLVQKRHTSSKTEINAPGDKKTKYLPRVVLPRFETASSSTAVTKPSIRFNDKLAGETDEPLFFIINVLLGFKIELPIPSKLAKKF